MADMRCGKTGRIGWYSPDPRAVLSLAEGGVHVSRSLARTIRRSVFELTTDETFEGVMRACAAPRGGDGLDGAWISEEMIGAYTGLHQLGHAHSVEAWRGAGSQRQLVGGIYGVSIGAAFFAESMFCRPERGGTDASKVCLVMLAAHLRRAGYRLLDVQIANPHTLRLGAVEVGRDVFLAALGHALPGQGCWGSTDEFGRMQADPRRER